MPSGLDWLVAEREAARRRRRDGHIEQIRDAAWDRFLARGFPTTRDEEWRFTSVAPIAAGPFNLVPQVSGSAADIRLHRMAGAAAELIFVDGHYVPAVSSVGMLPGGVRIESLASRIAASPASTSSIVGRVAPDCGGPFAALNMAFLDDGAVVELPAGAIVAQPVHLVFISSGHADGRATMAHPHVVIALGEHAQASIVETYAGPGDARYLTNAMSEIALGENAVLEHYRLQYEGAEAYHIGATHMRARRSATYVSHAISLGGALVRNDVIAVLAGEGVGCTLNGLYASDGGRIVDNHTTIDHAKPHCGSREIYKGILAGRSRGVFNGKIIVRPDAQKTDAKQTNRALLLSEDARINTKPQLEIFANDVKCTHGAAVGQLDEEALFYLRSRGIGRDAARRLLIHAFAADVLDRLRLPLVRAAAERRLHTHLARALSQAA